MPLSFDTLGLLDTIKTLLSSSLFKPVLQTIIISSHPQRYLLTIAECRSVASVVSFSDRNVWLQDFFQGLVRNII